MAGDSGPSYGGRKKKKSGVSPVGVVLGALALWGALMLVLSVNARSVGAAGDQVDGWIGKGVDAVMSLTGQAKSEAGEAAKEATVSTGRAVQDAGEAIEKSAN